jgi:glycosyltransferase involved in cell wall biosynthesis
VKILLVHNYYGSGAPSGENQVFELERALLERHGYDVQVFVAMSDRLRARPVLGRIEGALVTPWSWRGARDVRREVVRFAPDVVHAHNTFPLLSPAIFHAIGTRAARVLTLHNYRLHCAAAIPLRNGQPCTECMDRRSVLPALRHGCYRGSVLATAPLAASVALHRALGTWERQVEAFVALTEFQRELMVASGLPAERTWVKPNFYPGSPKPLEWSQRRECVVFAGRLSEEKGVAHLVDAWIAWGDSAPELRILGDGPLRRSLEARASAAVASGRIRFLGQVAPSEAETEIARARLLALPSVWFEGFPMVLREAFAFGTPAAVSGIGPLPRIVEHGRTGVVFRPGDAATLLKEVRSVWNGGTLETMSRAARLEFELRYAQDANRKQLMAIYERAIEVQKERAGLERSAT